VVALPAFGGDQPTGLDILPFIQAGISAPQQPAQQNNSGSMPGRPLPLMIDFDDDIPFFFRT